MKECRASFSIKNEGDLKPDEQIQILNQTRCDSDQETLQECLLEVI